MQDLTMKILVVLATAIPTSFTPALDAGPSDKPALAALASPDLAPETLLDNAIRELLEIAQQHQTPHDPESLDPPPGSLTAAVEAKIRPLFDIETMVKLVLGRNWRLATPEQKEALATEFGRLLVQTCVAALASSHNPTFVLKPLLPMPDDDTLTVRSFVTQSESKPWTIDYDMKKTPAGWKIVDIKMEGMRLVTIHRDAFAELVREQGMDGLLTSLAAWNHRGDQRTADARQHFPAALILMHISTQRGLLGGG